MTGGCGRPKLPLMFLLGLAGEGRGFDPLALLLVALALDAVVGEMTIVFRRVPHPVTLMGRAIEVMERKLNRPHRSATDRAMRGALVVVVVAGGCFALGWSVAWAGHRHWAGQAVELILVVLLVAQRSLFDHVRDVGRALRDLGLAAGRTAVARIVGRDPQRLDEYGVARAAIESCAENFSDGVVAPVFWYLLFGLPGLMAYKAVNTLDSMIGHTSDRFRAFGFTAARLDDVLNLIPARLSGLYLAMVALFVPGSHPVAALGTMLRDARKHRSPNAGWPEAAMAGAIGLSLAGPRHYAEDSVRDPWIGDGRAQATPLDIRRCLYVFVVACLINALTVAAVLLIRLRASG